MFCQISPAIRLYHVTPSREKKTAPPSSCRITRYVMNYLTWKLHFNRVAPGAPNIVPRGRFFQKSKHLQLCKHIPANGCSKTSWLLYKSLQILDTKFPRKMNCHIGIKIVLESNIKLLHMTCK